MSPVGLWMGDYTVTHPQTNLGKHCLTLKPYGCYYLATSSRMIEKKIHLGPRNIQQTTLESLK